MFTLLAIYIVVHAPGGREIDINAKKIISMYEATNKPNKNLTDEARCMINLEDGKFVSAVETCEEVRRLIEQEESEHD